jgi:hypothetical protein
VTDIRDLLHGLNNELSIAVLELELLLERSDIDEESRQSLLRALDACRRAAVGVRQGGPSSPRATGRPRGPPPQ